MLGDSRVADFLCYLTWRWVAQVGRRRRDGRRRTAPACPLRHSVGRRRRDLGSCGGLAGSMEEQERCRRGGNRRELVDRELNGSSALSMAAAARRGVQERALLVLPQQRRERGDVGLRLPQSGQVAPAACTQGARREQATARGQAPCNRLRERGARRLEKAGDPTTCDGSTAEMATRPYAGLPRGHHMVEQLGAGALCARAR
jgi:hypothetical protein